MPAAVFYVPSLHRSSVPRELPPEVVFFPSGLGKSAGTGAALEAHNAAARALPLDPAQARAVLEELQRMGEELSPNGLLRQRAFDRTMPGKGALRRDEATALNAFDADEPEQKAVNGPDRGGMHGQAGVREALVDCQKILLLADTQEERAAELVALEKRFQEAEAALGVALSEEDPAGAAGGEEGEGVSGAGRPDDTLSVPWRVLVDAVLPFLPERAVLFTADEVMAADLQESGMLRPFPADRVDDVCAAWPPELASGLLFVCLPAWRLVGRRSLPENRPWLDREVEVVVAGPKGGWNKG